MCKEELNLIMAMLIERGENTHGKGEMVKIPLLPNNVGKKSVKNSVPTIDSRHPPVTCFPVIAQKGLYMELTCPKESKQHKMQKSARRAYKNRHK